MITELSFADYGSQFRDFISRSQNPAAATEAQFDALALTLFQLQFQYNAAYRHLCAARGMEPDNIATWREIPAAPTGAFKEIELTTLSPNERTKVFLSSGSTEQRRSRHFHSTESLTLYEASLLPWFERHLLADLGHLVEEQLLGPLDKPAFLALTPPPDAAPHSSLAHMFETVRREFGARDSQFTGRVNNDGAWTVEMDATLFAIRKSMCANRPLVLLGTAFNFVHLLDDFAANNRRYRLARGSRVLETGGYKAQSRALPKTDLHELTTKYLGITPEYIVSEYGMSELSSQAYDRVAGRLQGPTAEVGSQSEMMPSHFQFPPWCRVQIISPETGGEVAEGETGLIRIFDLANVRSVMAIQTEDLGIRRGNGFDLMGRARQAEPRGCSLMSLNTMAK